MTDKALLRELSKEGSWLLIEGERAAVFCRGVAGVVLRVPHVQAQALCASGALEEISRRGAGPESGRSYRLASAGSAKRRINGVGALAWLQGRKILTEVEAKAAQNLRRDFELSSSHASITQNWAGFALAGVEGRRGGGGGEHHALVRAQARRRLDDACKIMGPGLADVAIQVCCKDEEIGAVERRMGWSARSGKVVLRLALQRLVELYA